ncbi:frizzled-2-like protein, partial [Leptotrombidium deliense]
MYPNLMNHASQLEAERNINQYRYLIDTKCSPYLQHFLCLLYAP